MEKSKRELAFDKLEVDKELEIGGTPYKVSSIFMKGKAKICFIEVMGNSENHPSSECTVITKNENLIKGIVFINKEKLKSRGYTEDECMAIYAHELGHILSKNQKQIKRNIDDEIDADRYAVEKCGINPNVLKSALMRDFKYKKAKIERKRMENQEVDEDKVNKYFKEMNARIKNAQNLIEKNKGIGFDD